MYGIDVLSMDTFLTKCCRGDHHSLYRLWELTACNLTRANVYDKMSWWSGSWHYITTVSLYLINNRALLNYVLDKKLAIALKTLLVLEATAKVAFIVEGTLVQKGMMPRSRSLNYKHIYRCFQPLLVVLLQTTQYASPLMASLPTYLSLTGMLVLVTAPKYEHLTFPQVYSTRIWSFTSNAGFVQGSRILEA